MPFTFDSRGPIVVPTGSFSVLFKANADPLPAAITIEVTNSSLVTTSYADLALISDPSSTWQAVELAGPLAFGDVYQVKVFFDAVEVYSGSVEVPLPGKRRSAVLRQRIFEVLQRGYLTGQITAVPFGTLTPDMVGTDINTSGGSVIEVGAGYVQGVSRWAYDSKASDVTIPIRIHGAIDESEDTEDLVADFEDVAGYILAADWFLAGFGVTQSEASIGGSEPEITEDRKMAVVRGTLTVPMRSKI